MSMDVSDPFLVKYMINTWKQSWKCIQYVLCITLASDLKKKKTWEQLERLIVFVKTDIRTNTENRCIMIVSCETETRG